jgi:L-ascorbate metabolism protein UlaG (beta-lactamase superfamily)
LIITFLGTNCLLIRSSFSRVIIDPFFSRPGIFSILFRKIKPDRAIIEKYLKRIEIKTLDAVVLTHTHYDHALDAPEVALLTGARLIGSLSAMNLGRGGGLPETQLYNIHALEKMKIGDLSVTFFNSRHMPFPGMLDRLLGARDDIKNAFAPPAHALAYRAGDVYSVLIEDKSCKLLVIGSSGYILDSLKGCVVDVVCLGVGGLDWNRPAYAAQYFRESVLNTEAKRVILTHWDNFTHPLDSGPRYLGRIRSTMEELRKMGEDSGIKVERAQTWQSIEI